MFFDRDISHVNPFHKNVLQSSRFDWGIVGYYKELKWFSTYNIVPVHMHTTASQQSAWEAKKLLQISYSRRELDCISYTRSVKLIPNHEPWARFRLQGSSWAQFARPVTAIAAAAALETWGIKQWWWQESGGRAVLGRAEEWAKWPHGKQGFVSQWSLVPLLPAAMPNSLGPLNTATCHSPA